MRVMGVLAAAILTAASAGAASADYVRVSGGKVGHQTFRSHKSPDYANAKPRAMPQANAPLRSQRQLLESGASIKLKGAPSFVPGGEGTGETTPVIVPTNKALQRSEAPPAPEYGNSGLPYTTSIVKPANQDWHRVAGKLFYNIRGEPFLCSGALVKPGIVLTAAHCVTEFGAGDFFTDFEFIPAYQDGKAPFGVWRGQDAYVLNPYLNGADFCTQRGVVCESDVAVIVLAPKKGKFPGNQTGWFGWGVNGYSYNSDSQVLVTQLGYPISLNKGEWQIRTDAQGSIDDSRAGNTVFGSLQTGGSSGGPILVNFNNAVKRDKSNTAAKEPNRNLIIGVTSWVGPDKNKEMGSSLFTPGNVTELVNAACQQYPKACK